MAECSGKNEKNWSTRVVDDSSEQGVARDCDGGKNF